MKKFFSLLLAGVFVSGSLGSYQLNTSSVAFQLGLQNTIAQENSVLLLTEEYTLSELNNRTTTTYFSDGLLCIPIDDKYGFIDVDGNIVIEGLYDEPSNFMGNGYCVVLKDGKYGIIDTKNNTTTAFTYDDLTVYSNAFGLIASGDKLFSLSSGKLISYPYEVLAILNVGEYVMVKNDEKIGIIDKNFQMPVPFSYEEIQVSTADDIYYISAKQDGKWGMIDLEDNVLIDFLYDDIFEPINHQTALCTKKGDSYGILDLDGKELYPFLFPEMVYGFDFEANSVSIADSSDYSKAKYGIFDMDGKEIIPFVYDATSAFNDEGIAVARLDGKYGFINEKNEIVLPFSYDYVLNFDAFGLACFEKDGLFGMMDIEGTVVIEAIYQTPILFSAEGFSINCLDDKYGMIDLEENTIIPFSYDLLTLYNPTFDSYAEIEKDSILLARINDGSIGKYGLLDMENEVTEEFVYHDMFSLYIDFNEKSYAIIEQNGKYGIINEKREELVPFEYDFINNYITDDVTYGIKDGQSYIINLKPFLESQEEAEQEADNEEKKAIPTSSTVNVDGKAISFDAYNIEDNNYFKLRDLAHTLNGTNVQFNVTWDGEKEAINLISNEAYTSVGTEMTQGNGKEQMVLKSTASLYLNGKKITMQAYTINDNTYFKLRDVGTTFGFAVDWDADTNSVLIDTASNIDFRAFEEEVLRLVNEEREKEDIEPLQIFEPAMDLARAKSEDMATRNYYAHADPDGVYSYYALQEYGTISSENISASQKTPEAVVETWMNSSAHKANILDEKNKYIGIGFYYDAESDWKYYWTQMFMSALNEDALKDFMNDEEEDDDVDSKDEIDDTATDDTSDEDEDEEDTTVDEDEEDDTTVDEDEEDDDNDKIDDDEDEDATEDDDVEEDDDDDEIDEARAFEEEVVRLVNIEREKEGVALMTIFEPAMDLARAKSQDMVDRNYYAHADEDGIYMYKELDVYGFASGENIAAGQTTPEAVVTAWLNSDGHRANILKETNLYIGVGFVHDTDSDWNYYWTQMFMSSVDDTTSIINTISEEQNEDTTIDLSEDVIYEKLIAMKEEYPHGMKWTNDDIYRYLDGITSVSAGGCAGFAALLSDVAFGTELPRTKIYNFDTLRVGDILRINDNTHSVVVLAIDGDTITIAEGNYNSSIYWGRELSLKTLQNSSSDLNYVETRYPQ